MPLVKVISGAVLGDNTEAIRLHPNEDGAERWIQVGGDAAEVSGDELRSIASHYSVEVIEDAAPPVVQTSPSSPQPLTPSSSGTASTSTGMGA